MAGGHAGCHATLQAAGRPLSALKRVGRGIQACARPACFDAGIFVHGTQKRGQAWDASPAIPLTPRGTYHVGLRAAGRHLACQHGTCNVSNCHMLRSWSIWSGCCRSASPGRMSCRPWPNEHWAASWVVPVARCTASTPLGLRPRSEHCVHSYGSSPDLILLRAGSRAHLQVQPALLLLPD